MIRAAWDWLCNRVDRVVCRWACETGDDEDPWFTPKQRAELDARIAKRLAEVDALPTDPPF